MYILVLSISLFNFFMIVISSTMVSKIHLKNKNLIFCKIQPYQCGFSPFRAHRFSFSMQFFAVGMLFMIFDVEMLVLMPYLMNFYYYFNTVHFLFMMMFLFFLLISLVYEWNFKNLNWKF